MGDSKGDGKDKERIVNFALLIQQSISTKGIQVHIESQNQGIADSDVILIVEAQLEKVKDKIKSGLAFGGKDKKQIDNIYKDLFLTTTI